MDLSEATTHCSKATSVHEFEMSNYLDTQHIKDIKDARCRGIKHARCRGWLRHRRKREGTGTSVEQMMWLVLFPIVVATGLSWLVSTGLAPRRPRSRREAQFGGRTGCCVKADSYLSTLSRPQAPSERNDWHEAWLVKLDASLQRLTGERLLDGRTAKDLAEDTSLIVVSHDSQDPPVFNYASQAGLDLWEMSWDQFVSLPSRYSAAEDAREARELLMADVKANGFSRSYNGTRISSSGSRFQINNVLIWNVLDDESIHIGQAAMFHRDTVRFLEEDS